MLLSNYLLLRIFHEKCSVTIQGRSNSHPASDKNCRNTWLRYIRLVKSYKAYLDILSPNPVYAIAHLTQESYTWDPMPSFFDALKYSLLIHIYFADRLPGNHTLNELNALKKHIYLVVTALLTQATRCRDIFNWQGNLPYETVSAICIFEWCWI